MIDWKDYKQAVRVELSYFDEFGQQVGKIKKLERPTQTKTVKDAVEWSDSKWVHADRDVITYSDEEGFSYSKESYSLDDGEQIVCTYEQFEAYVKEQEGKKWTHKNPPPVGTKCKYALGESSSWWDCEVISHNRLVIHCPHIESVEHCGLQIVGESKTVRFKPIKPTISESEAIGILKVNRHLSFAALLEDYDVVKA